ncbi:MAG TPA: neurogenic locus notch [Legionella sp.]|nr:neurogenic locus notch [Legionella sp.]
MRSLHHVILISLMLLCIPFTSAWASCDNCCGSMGGILYCDSSAGRYVCKNGDYSACYCTRHAVMDLQKIEGCCLWQGGVFKVNEMGLVICNNGGVSEMCSLQAPEQRASM